jgi:hypothetical protein
MNMDAEKTSVKKVTEGHERQDGAQKSGMAVKIDVGVPSQEARLEAKVDKEVGCNANSGLEGVYSADIIRVGNVMVQLGGRQVKSDCAAVTLKASASGVVEDGDNSDKGRKVYMRKYRSVQDDMMRARTGVVATITNGDATPVVRSRIKDAGFTDVDILHLGADKVFVRHVAGLEVVPIIENAREFFTMIFSHWERWERKATPFQRGAWVRLYGVPLHAWNEKFFKLCVFDCGRFLRADNYTVEKDRLDFARVLIATSSLEVVKRVERLLVDDSLIDVQVI